MPRRPPARRRAPTGPATLRTVFFDFGGTLSYADPEVVDDPAKVWSQVAQRLGLPFDEARFRRVDADAERHFTGQIYRYVGRTDEFWKRRDRWIMDRLGIHAQREALIDGLQAIFEDPARVVLYPETRAVLEEVRALGYRTGVISNFTDRLVTLLDHLRLSDAFDSVTFSQQVGVEKPDVRIFRTALERDGCAPEGALHIGDSWEADYLGATRAGLRGVWLNRGKAPPPSSCPSVHDLRGLVELLAQEPTGRGGPAQR